MHNIGRVLMSLAIAIYAFIPPLVDLGTDSHVFHDGWLPHARMHTVWLLGLTTMIGVGALYLLWSRPAQLTRRSANIDMAGWLSTCVYAAFFLSAATISAYGGALSDLDGGVEKGPFGIDANLVTFSAASVLLCAGWLMARRDPGN